MNRNEKLIAICDYGNKKDNVYAVNYEDDKWKWRDSIGESDDYFYSPKDALNGFVNFMKKENNFVITKEI